MFLLQLMNEREVRGVVKLKFRSINGESVVCHRMLQSTQKVKCGCCMHCILGFAAACCVEKARSLACRYCLL